MAAAERSLTSEITPVGASSPRRLSALLMAAALAAAGCPGTGDTPTDGPTASPAGSTPTDPSGGTPTETGSGTPTDPAGGTATPGGGTPTASGSEGTPTPVPPTPTIEPSKLLEAVTTLRASGGDPISGAALCQEIPFSDRCGTSGSDGGVSVKVPAESEVLLSVSEVPDHPLWNVTLNTADAPVQVGAITGDKPGVILRSESELSTLASAAGLTLNSSLGILRVRVVETSNARVGTVGQSANLIPAKGDGPFYLDAGGKLVPSATSTSTDGSIYWFNVPAQAYVVEIKTKGAICAPGVSNWPGDTATQIRLPARGNQVTYGEVVCSPEKDRPAAARLQAGDWGAQAEAVAAAWMAKVDPRSMAWNWREAVLMIGMQAVYARTGDPAVVDYARAWIDWHIARGYRITSSDSTVPATSALFLWHETADPTYLAPVEDARAYLADSAPYLDDGTVAHATLVPNQAWVDSLFMLGSFYTWDAALGGHPEGLATLADQYRLFNGHLWSDWAGLYWHMYNEPMDAHVPASPTFWGRGNGWVLASLALALTEMPANHPDRADLIALFQAHAEGAMRYQEPSGLWHTVLNRADSYEETSATALLTFGLLRGYSLGILGQRAREHGLLGLEALADRIVLDDAGYPVITGISKATNPGPYQYYAHVPVGDDEPYGVGAALLALEEGASLP